MINQKGSSCDFQGLVSAFPGVGKGNACRRQKRKKKKKKGCCTAKSINKTRTRRTSLDLTSAGLPEGGGSFNVTMT